MSIKRCALKNTRNSIHIFLPYILALISAGGLLFYLTCLHTLNKDVLGSAVALPLICAFSILWKTLLKSVYDKKTLIFHLAFAGILACVMGLGSVFSNLNVQLSIKRPLIDAACLAIALMPALSACMLCLCQVSRRIQSAVAQHRSNFTKNAELSAALLRQLHICFGIVCLIWFITWLAVWPGIVGIDSWTWYRDFLEGNPSAHWSLIYQSVFFIFVRCADLIFHDASLGHSLFTLLQLIFILSVIYHILKFIAYEAGSSFLIGATAFFTCNIPLALLAVTSTQDAPFSACFAMFILLLFKALLDPKRLLVLKNKIYLLFCLLGLCLLRNNGLYVVLILGIFLFLCNSTLQRSLALVFSILLALCLLYSKALLPLLGVSQSTYSRELLSVPSTQLVYTYYREQATLTSEQKDVIESYFTSDLLHRDVFPFNYRIADENKLYIKSNKIMQNPINFLNFLRDYLSFALQYPDSYLLAHLELTYGLWYPDVHYYDTRMYHPYIDYADGTFAFMDSAWGPTGISIDRSSKFPLYKRLLDSLFGNRVAYSNPNWQMNYTASFALTLISKAAIFFWGTFYLALYALCWKQKQLLYILMPLLALFLTVILGPVVLFRYVAPCILVAPVMVLAYTLLKERPHGSNRPRQRHEH